MLKISATNQNNSFKSVKSTKQHTDNRNKKKEKTKTKTPSSSETSYI